MSFPVLVSIWRKKQNIRLDFLPAIIVPKQKKTFSQEGIECEIVQIGLKDVRGCIACRHCKENGKCVFDDVVNELAPKFEKADGLVIASPVYYASANATLIASSQYWNSIHGLTCGEADADEEGKQTMRTLAGNMSFLIKSIALGKEKY